MKKILLVASVSAAALLSGCASNDELVQQQQKHTGDIQTLQQQQASLEERLNAQNAVDKNLASAISEVKHDFTKAQEMNNSIYAAIEDDTLLKIAAKHNMSLEQLIDLNPNKKNTDKLLIGEIIKVK
ncbi:LysM peptidoglycan-binding domain-containing protein [Vibrio vulnificus]|nr:LysM peptidoglycan-binding domain-containing protein [Vibrio vulnificus]ELR8772617.1 LysM peptidoglycan-binding domain-containing protein [Vibrio vulnificus]